MELNAKKAKSDLEGLAKFRTCPEYIKNALALINSQEQEKEKLGLLIDELEKEKRELFEENKRLTEENEAWQKALITEKENADKAYYELACEVENLRDENERLRAELEKRPPKLIITKLQKETELNATEDKP